MLGPAFAKPESALPKKDQIMRRLIQSFASDVYRRFGAYVPRSIFYPVYRWLYPPGTARPKTLFIDLVGSCNLRCPSCPNGNMELGKGARLSLEKFEQIIQKAKREYGIVGVGLYNWTEPFLHPELPEFIRIAKREKLICAISTNFNIIRNLDEVLLAGPDTIRISLSGFTQETYGQTHTRGDIEKVKENLVALSEARKRLRAHKTAIYLYFHKYKHNLHELEPMKEFGRSLGFDWFELWALYMPVERMIELAEGRLSPDRMQFVENQLALPIGKAVEAARAVRHEPCSMRDDQLVLDAAGDLNICCAAYEKSVKRLGHFLEMTPDDVIKAKKGHPLCGRCAAHGLHRYFEYMTHPVLGKAYEKLALENLSRPKF